MTISKLKQIEQAIQNESAKPRIGKVKFYGVCDFCDRRIDITNKMEFNRKIELVDNYGVDKIDNEWVCNYVSLLQNCPFCSKPPF